MVEQEDIEIPEFQGNRHARYRGARGANERAQVPGYNLSETMNLDELDEVDINNEHQYFIHHNTTFPDISINPNEEEEDAVRIKFFGCNSIYITDGTTQLLIDPFFSRPRANMDFFWNRRRQIRSDPRIVEATLDHAQIQSVDAILMTHAHWDHALDIAEVWHALHPPDSDYPKIYGCDSIYHVAQGGDVPDSYFQPPVRNRIFRIGNFKVCFIPGKHALMPTIASQHASEGSITQRLPSTNFGTARVDDYREGEISDILIEHRHGLILNKGSANFVPGSIGSFINMHSSRVSARPGLPSCPADQNRFIDVVILSCAGFNTLGWVLRRSLASYDEDRRVYNNFWDEVISPTKPYLLLFSHWDEFTEGRDNMLDKPPRWMYSAYECKDLFEGELRGRRIHTDRRVSREGRAGIALFRRYKTRFIPFWEEITILPICEWDSEGNPRRRTSVFHLPDEPDGTLVR
jgi:hypothetical protein